MPSKTASSPKASSSATWTLSLAIALVAGTAGYLGLASFGSTRISSMDYAARTDYILRTTPLIDGHNDLPYLLRIELQDKLYNSSFDFRNCKFPKAPFSSSFTFLHVKVV